MPEKDIKILLKKKKKKKYQYYCESNKHLSEAQKRINYYITYNK